MELDLEMRPPTADEIPAFTRAVDAQFGGTSSDEENALWALGMDPSRMLAVFDGGEIVGTSGAWAMEQTMPGGGRVPVAGVTVVGVSPTHRRRGLLNRMMDRLLDDALARGESIAILTASESVIYGRYGFGWATSMVDVEVECDRSAFIAPVQAGGRIRRIDKDSVLKIVPALHDRVWPARVGDVTATGGHWDRLVADLESWRDGASGLFYALHESDDGEPDGFTAYRYKHHSEHGNPKSAAIVQELFAESAEVEAALFRYLLDLDLVATVRIRTRPVDDHLRRRLAESRRYKVLGVGDDVWLRLVDVAGALALRGYRGDDSVVIEVADAKRPQNDGRYRVGNAGCERTTDEADVMVPVDSLGAAFLGGVSFAALALAGRASENRPGGLDRADALFLSSVQPYAAHGF
ncbi:MAG: hypothetical protein QOK43_2840 [Acidimicrobiaceae bacterium]|nr:hypothetical protein [Acidimicrobiaceae bacterium]